MRGNRSRDTLPEIALRRKLHRLGVRYRKWARPSVLAGRSGSADLLFIGARVAVYVDGCFWHGCAEHFRLPRTNSDYWLEKIERNRKRDRQIDAQLLAASWVPVRVWEHEPPAEVVQRILGILDERRCQKHTVLAPLAIDRLSM